MSVNNTSSVSQYYVVLQDADHSDEAQEYMQKSIKKLVSKDDYVYVQSLSAAMAQMSSMINVMVGVLTAIAGISLLVGGIGIMNIMLASVYERRKEIGTRRALGAQKSDILLQFLIETVFLTSTGGVLGIMLGVGIGRTITYYTEMPTIYSAWSIALALAISSITGVIFGTYPAYKAAQQNPITVLRAE